MKRIINFFKLLISILQLKKVNVIICPPESIRFGNHLYYLLYCYQSNKKSSLYNYCLLENSDLSYWLEKFPGLKKLTKNNNSLSYTDIKVKDYSYHQKFDIDFNEAQLNSFIDQFLKNEIIEKDSIINHASDLVINLRIGDYYASGNVGKYGYDQVKYLKYILEETSFVKTDMYKRIFIISDDQQWCREHLGFLESYCDEIIISDVFNDPFTCIINLSLSQNLIISNSTFSYWGAYISNRLNNGYNIIAPAFHSRMVEQDIAYQLNPKWKIISKKEFNFEGILCKD